MKILLYISLLSSIIYAQIKPHLEPDSFNNKNHKSIIQIKDDNIKFNLKETQQQYYLDSKNNLCYFEIYIEKIPLEITFYIIDLDKNTFIGPYSSIDEQNGIIKTDIIKGKNLILEINNSKTSNKIIKFSILYNEFKNFKINQHLPSFKSRDEPIILVTGFWPPTNEMIRHFSQNPSLNPSWEGENWENSGYDIISYFPTFDDPDCSNCGQGYGDFEVDYQDTSEDFWTIFESIKPIGIITFSRGYINYSWELENNYFNRTNWYNDYSSPYLPTPNPPDGNEEIMFMRNSNLPMNEIVDNINNMDIGLDAYIDINGDPGHFVSEFMGYHGVWYRDLYNTGTDKCIAAGHIHVGGQISTDNAKIATEETIRTFIDYLDQFSYNSGDVNNDSTIDILDLVIIMNSILGNVELSSSQFYASDLNEDGIINIQDIIILISIIMNNH